MKADPEQQIDGRHARSQRARAAIINAVMALIEEGNLDPPAQAVADRAGVSLRLVFHHFKDMESLFHEMFAALFDTRIAPFLPFPSGEGPWEERLAAFVEKRAGLFEAIGPIRRAGKLKEPFSAATAEALNQGRVANAAQAMNTFGPELASQPESVRSTITHALVMATSFAAWDMLRRHQGLSLEEAKKVLAESIQRLLRAPSS